MHVVRGLNPMTCEVKERLEARLDAAILKAAG